MDERFINNTPTSLSFKHADLSGLSYKNARLELTLICPAIKSELRYHLTGYTHFVLLTKVIC
ncbi:Uncharacterised protein [Escherichia coli]|nr:Uncharacterised protein [Escherichia coli]